MLALQHFRPLRNALRIISAERSPRQIAAAVALGAMIGLLPKGNLLAVTLSVLLFSVRVNLGVGLTAAFFVSLAAPQLSQLTHQFGVRAYQVPWIYQGIRHVYDWPLVPWTSLNNTVVLGSALLGLVLCYPIYHLSYLATAGIQDAWSKRPKAHPHNDLESGKHDPINDEGPSTANSQPDSHVLQDTGQQASVSATDLLSEMTDLNAKGAKAESDESADPVRVCSSVDRPVSSVESTWNIAACHEPDGRAAPNQPVPADSADTSHRRRLFRQQPDTISTELRSVADEKPHTRTNVPETTSNHRSKTA